MAKAQKMDLSPTKASVPKAFAPIIKAFSIESESVAKDLIHQAATAVYSCRDGLDFSFGSKQASPDEIERWIWRLKLKLWRNVSG